MIFHYEIFFGKYSNNHFSSYSKSYALIAEPARYDWFLQHPLDLLDGFNNCRVLLGNHTDFSARYNCSGKIINYQDHPKFYETYIPYDSIANNDTNKLSSNLNSDYVMFDNSTSSLVYNKVIDFNQSLANFTIEKRNNIGQQILTNVCSNFTSFIEWFADKVVTFFKDAGDECETSETWPRHNGSGHLVAFEVYDNKRNGHTCDTNAKINTIVGALQKWMSDHEHFCRTFCFRLNHGSGNWEGFINIGVERRIEGVTQCTGGAFTYSDELCES